jgi:hypothetical protein
VSRPVDGALLKARREELGLTLEEVSRRTRIPVSHLAAIEEERLRDLPPGPYVGGWVRAYCDLLEIEGDITVPEVTADVGARQVPLWGVRAVALGAVIVLMALLGANVLRAGVEAFPRPDDGTVADVHVRLRAEQAGRFRVEVDDRVALDRVLAPGDTHEFAGRHRVVVDVPAVEAARVTYRDEEIVPQGRQDSRRRLVFEDDLGSAR